jgi:uncharacterized protein YutE (UPF0331/DUF86 family)
MSKPLHDQVALERQMLRRLLGEYRALLDKCAKEPPAPIERAALAAILHAFYNGVENVFKRIASEYDGGIPGGSTAHRDLLDLMVRAAPNRPRVISEALCDRLDPYLDFRHMFRHAYSFQLEWDKMEMLVRECESVLDQFDTEITAFLAGMDKEQ